MREKNYEKKRERERYSQLIKGTDMRGKREGQSEKRRCYTERKRERLIDSTEWTRTSSLNLDRKERKGKRERDRGKRGQSELFHCSSSLVDS